MRDQYLNCGHTILLPFITRAGARVTHKETTVNTV